MCRLLLINSRNEFDISEELEKFAEIAKNSKEYQGDGWGIVYYEGQKRKVHHSLKPIWEDDFGSFGSSKLILVHARSAFNDDLKPIEHNMPFVDEKYNFIFNGELRGVKIKADGRIGAEKIFNFIKRFDKNGLFGAIKKANEIIDKRTEYIRAMNYIMTDGEYIYINNFYNEDGEYFSLRVRETDDVFYVCSQELTEEEDWKTLGNKGILRRKIL